MNLSQRNRNIILWVVAIGLLISMVISFTPGTLFGGASQREAAEGPVALNVNGEPVRELEIARLEQTPPFNAVQEGPVAEDLQTVLLDQVVSQELLQRAAADVDISSAEVRERVNEFREQQGVAGGSNDRAYQDLIAGAGYTDDTFRDLIRTQVQQEKYLDSLTEGVSVTGEEVETYYAANQNAYRSEPRITAREIVVADRALADRLYARAVAGEDFAALARENSTERAEQGGALGAAEGESTPQPVTRVALPTAVAEAAFALQGPGLTAPIEAGGAFHIVKVEAYEPGAPRPLDEVRGEVETDVLELKEAAAQENALLNLKADAEVSAPEGSRYRYQNPTVARVGDTEIKAAELGRATYLNPQIQQLLNPNFADIIASSVKPNVLDQLVDEELAYQGAQRLDATFVGPRAAVAQSALGYVGRDVEVTDANIRSYYRDNQAAFTVEPSALTTRVNFPDAASARDFRRALTGAQSVDAEAVRLVAEASDGTVQNLGNVTPATQPEVIDTALFNFGRGPEAAMTPLGDGLDISRVLTVTTPAADTSASGGAASGGAPSGGAGSVGAGAAPQQQFVVLVAARTPERVRPLREVRTQVEQGVLEQQRTRVQQDWLAGLRRDIPVENLLAAQTAPAGAQSGGAGGGGSVPTLTPTPAPESGGAN